MTLAQIDIGTKFLNNSDFLTETTDVGKLISTIVSNAIVIAGVILLFLIVLGGIGIISGSGSNNPEKTEKGKKMLSSALIGFIIVFTAYWIVQLIGKLTGISLLE